MKDFLTVEYYESWNIVLDGLNVPIKLDTKEKEISKGKSEFNNINHKTMEKNDKDKKNANLRPRSWWIQPNFYMH